MLEGEKIGLRARIEADVAVLHEELFDDVVTRSRADNRAWRPIAAGPFSPYSPSEPSEEFAAFSVVELENGELVGEAVLWSIDVHNRSAHVGISLRPRFRGRGLGVDVVEVLSRYAFDVLGLHRLQLETEIRNGAMRGVAEHCGFLLEGTIRDSAWADGAFHSEIIFGLLVEDWRDRQIPKSLEKTGNAG
jgi:RimJ/RimL family protein N-acetyltransferase